MEQLPQSSKPGGAPGQAKKAGQTPGTRTPTAKGQLPAGKKRKQPLKAILLVLGIAAALGLATLGGVLAGYRSGVNARQSSATEQALLSVKDQYDLAVQDLAEGRYEVARQRLEYILAYDPNYPGATDRLTEALSILYATATPSPLPPTITPTPTRDPRPVQELFSQAQSLVSSSQWDQAIDTLLAVRQADPAHQTARVDGMLFISLRQRGVEKIINLGNLEGGAYDLALAERFAPLDVQANSWRELARLYLTGSSFWEVIPEQAVYYFSQVAAAAPGMRDSSGLTASERYRLALAQYGDQLGKNGDWCAAQEQYELSLAIGVDAAIQEKRDNAALQCSPPSATPGEATPTPSLTLPAGVTPSATSPFIPTPTNTQQPPVTTEPPPATTEPPPATTEPPPATTEPPPPETTEPPVSSDTPAPALLAPPTTPVPG
jgi:hypothetical protein